jgi:hypothetical protein
VLWRADLSAAGLKGAQGWNLSYSQFFTIDPQYYALSFSGEGTLVVTSVTPVRQAHGPVPRNVQAIVLDASTGRLLGRNEWQNVIASKVALFPTEKGNLVLRNREGLALYSQKFEELARIRLPEARQKVFEEWKVFVIPSQEFIVIVHVLGSDIQIQWLLPDTLAVRRSWMLAKDIPRARLFPTLSPSREKVVVSWEKPTKCEVSVQDGSNSWHTVFHDEEQCGAGAQFLNEETIFLPVPGEFRVLNVGGELLWREGLDKGERAFYVRASADGQRFAVPISALKGGSEFLDIGPHEVLKRIEVYDLRTHQCVYRLEGDLQNVSGFALAPDGLRLALLRDGIVELYQLPPDYKRAQAR